MRQDMKKVLCERPRARRIFRYKNFRRAAKLDDRQYQGMRRPYSEDCKELTDHIAPLIRYLHGCVGRRWDEVWSEICQQVPSNSVVDRHLKTHVDLEVERLVHVTEQGEIKALPTGHIHSLYVDPRDGCIHALPTQAAPKDHVVRRHGRRYRQGDDDILYPLEANRWHPVKPLDEDRELGYIDGIWYLFEFRPLSLLWDDEAGFPHVWLGEVYDQSVRRKVAVGLYRYSKVQLSRRQLRRYGVCNSV